MTPTFTVLIGSIGRPVLKNALDSIKRQSLVEGDQVIVSIDSFEHGEREDVQTLVRSYGEGFLATHYNSGYHWLGVEQINHAMRTVPMTGTHVLTIGDDDVFVDGAYEVFRHYCAQDTLRPVLWKFLAPNRWILWREPKMQSCLISGCCIAAPMPFSELMHTRLETTHDFDWMEAVIAKSGKTPLWLDYVGVIARPDQNGNDVMHQGVWGCNRCGRWHYREHLDYASPSHCYCGRVIDFLPREVAQV
jgi:hypothetical protein